jgi:hypothetical protein
MRLAHLSTLLALIVLLSGCSDLDPPPAGETIAPKQDSPDPVPAEQVLPQTDTTIDPSVPDLPETPADLVDPTSAASGEPAENVPAESSTQQVAAEAGVGIQGQSLEPGNMITEPARAFFSVKQKLVFTQVEHALQLYQATNDSLPQSTEEFMEKIVQANNLKLPELPRGHKYVFDAEAGNLMVEKPKQN